VSPLAWAALLLFFGVYVAISLEAAHKTIVALVGAAVFLLIGVLDATEAFAFIDWHVIFLLVSMMVIVNIARHTGMFQWVAIRTAKAARGEPVAILVLLSVVTAVISAFLDNVTTILITAPVTILIAVELGVSPVPFLVCGAIASNIGGTATLIGDPPNIMIGSAAGLTFNDFLGNLAPAILVCLAGFSLMAWLLFRGKLKVSATRKARIMTLDARQAIQNRPLLAKSLAVLAAVIAGFLLHDVIGVEASVVALTGASVLMVISDRHEVDAVLRDVEWGTIVFFIGLFVMVGGLVKLGLIGAVARWLIGLTGGDIPTTGTVVLWASGVLSAFIDNIPYVATMTPLIKDIGVSLGGTTVLPLWWALSLGACLGGNGTLVGASANLVAAGLAAKSGYKITFLEFTKYGALFMLMTLLVSTGYLWLRYFRAG
jgi:Na+/H+ antiporter NhaD/arsenite permease-like protein